MTTLTDDTITLSEKGIRITDWQEAHPEEAEEKGDWFYQLCCRLMTKRGIPMTEDNERCFDLAMAWPLLTWIDGITSGLTDKEATDKAIWAFINRLNELFAEAKAEYNEKKKAPAHDLD
jgi:hypothetical protein